MTEDVQTDECRSGENSCDPHAVCRDTFRSYNCFCTAGEPALHIVTAESSRQLSTLSST